MNVPKNYTSPDVIDRRQGQKPTLTDKARDLTIKVRNDWNDMKEEERARKGDASTNTKPRAAWDVPSFKKGGIVKKTGLIYAHKGEKVIPVKDRNKKSTKRGGKK